MELYPRILARLFVMPCKKKSSWEKRQKEKLRLLKVVSMPGYHNHPSIIQKVCAFSFQVLQEDCVFVVQLILRELIFYKLNLLSNMQQSPAFLEIKDCIAIPLI